MRGVRTARLLRKPSLVSCGVKLFPRFDERRLRK
jgi:hypothetical protein